MDGNRREASHDLCGIKRGLSSNRPDENGQLFEKMCQLLLMTLTVFLGLCVAEGAEPLKMKTISYRGGIITFQIPAHWKEEYQPEGGGMFYEDRPESGTLRLNVITAKAPEGKSPTNGYSLFISTPLGKGERLLQTSHGDGLKISKKSAVEKGVKIEMHCWQIAHCAPPSKIYIASFTWTILQSQDSDPKFQKEVEFLTEQISKAYFHPDLGKL